MVRCRVPDSERVICLSWIIGFLRRLRPPGWLILFPLDRPVAAGADSRVISGHLLFRAIDGDPRVRAARLVVCDILPFLHGSSDGSVTALTTALIRVASRKD